MKLKKIAAACALATSAWFGFGTAAHAQFSGDVIRIGIITDMSSVYADLDGQGGVEAIKMAIADAGGSVAGKKVEEMSVDLFPNSKGKDSRLYIGVPELTLQTIDQDFFIGRSKSGLAIGNKHDLAGPVAFFRGIGKAFYGDRESLLHRGASDGLDGFNKLLRLLQVFLQTFCT